MNAPKIGDRVRVVLEGEVRSASSTGFYVGSRGYENYLTHDAGHVVSVEVLAPPEPAWRPGDVVRANDGHIYVRVEGYFGRWGTAFPWLRNGQPGQGQHDRTVPRPLTPIVRDGKAVV